MDKSEEQGYKVSQEYASQMLQKNKYLIVPALKDIKVDIDSRELPPFTVHFLCILLLGLCCLWLDSWCFSCLRLLNCDAAERFISFQRMQNEEWICKRSKRQIDRPSDRQTQWSKAHITAQQDNHSIPRERTC